MNEITQDAIARIFGMHEKFNYMLMEETGIAFYFLYALISFIVISIIFKFFKALFHEINYIENNTYRYIFYLFSITFAVFYYISYANEYNSDLREHINSIRREDDKIFIYNQFIQDEIPIKKDDIKSIEIQKIKYLYKKNTLNLMMGSHDRIGTRCEIIIETNIATYTLNSFPENMYLLRLPSCI